MRIILLFTFIIIISSQAPQIYPNDTYRQTTASSRACFADCQFCQIKTGFCQECLSPFFQKDVNGNCVLVNGYTIQSSQQQATSGDQFIPSSVSWSNTRTTICAPDSNYFQNRLKVLGPFGASDGTITYRRSISNYKYMKLKFFLLKIGWTDKDSMTIVIRDQNNKILSNQTIYNSPNVPRQILCSSTTMDQRFSLIYDFQTTGVTSLFISFIPNFSSSIQKWSISTFLLLTGKCHQSCDDCFASSQATKCKNCKNFFIQNVDGICNICPDGFRKVIVNGVNKCQKCPIEYKTCQVSNQVCFYNYLSDQLTSSCTWNSKNNYVSQYFINTNQFSGSLFSVNGLTSNPSIYKCGDYSIVGLANQGQYILRFFTSIQAHQSISLSFNIFIVDQMITEKNAFQIFIDNVRVQTLFINMVGVSSICGNSNKQVFQTYPATKFFPHTRTENVNITIRSSNAKNWGIRNFRMSYHVCDQKCLECGPKGCVTCLGYYNLNGLQCNSCPSGSSTPTFQSNTCYDCSQNCLSCIINKTKTDMIQRYCTQCRLGYFVYQGKCQLLPNVGNNVNSSIIDWQSPNPIITNSTCSIDFKNQVVNNNKKLNFIVAQDYINNTFNLPQKHYKMLISFYLLKIDQWSPNDELNLYVNDLLVLRKKYTNVGNKICYAQAQNDLASYEEIQYEDDNKTLSVYFQVISSQNSSKRKFGISDFRVNPVGCVQCLNYDFSYKVQYNYDQALNVQVIFNRLYVNNDPALFKTIFDLYVNQQKMNYDITRNDSIRYFLQTHPQSEILLTNITVICRYPQKVTTDITQPINQQAFFQGRIMQQTKISKLKSLANSVSSVKIQRFTPLTSPSSSDGVRIFFQVVTRCVIYIGFFSFFVGCLTPCTHFMHNIQKLWLHIYVASLTIPNFLKFSLRGFRQSQDQNIAIYPSKWQVGIPEHLYYDAPAQYQDYYHDITFFRNIYNVGFAVAIYLVFSLIMYFLFRANKVGRPSQNRFIRHMKITFYRRPFFVFNSVIFYQYITVCIACTLQFIDLSTNTKQNAFKGINGAAAIIAFILATAYPLFHFFYLSAKQKDLYSIDYEITYRNRYHQIFYRFLPRDLWKIPDGGRQFNFQAIGFKQRFYNLLRFGQIWWMSFIFALMYNSPFAQAFLLIITNFIHLVFLWISSISYTYPFKILKVLQLMFFVGLQIMIIVSYRQNQTLTQDAYKTLGIVGVAFIFIILLLSFIRFVYTLIKLINEYKQHELKIDKIDQRLRNDDFYSSFDNNNQKIASQE